MPRFNDMAGRSLLEGDQTSCPMSAPPSVSRILGFALLIAATGVTWMVTWLYFAEQDPEDSPYWWKGLSYTGRVEQVTPTTITIQTDSGSQSFAISPMTRVVLIGQLSLHPGVTAQVKYIEGKTGQRMARGIRILKVPAGHDGNDSK